MGFFTQKSKFLKFYAENENKIKIILSTDF